ncbi:hypothetical protein [Actinocrispum wychmicini]|uniref:Uncharacterized protein n=1 Tax=Actinocrispum wychmicini TaxID=1213861 RepID=A0A4R2JK54_9PSEU|nr:hypothetical protein [Actinocrispum wychmicini]TCO56909.1 hypothetical protein EV192_106384 [Actinocrispum wychmicini]
MDWLALLIVCTTLVALLYVALRGADPSTPRELIIQALAEFVVSVIQGLASAIVTILTAPFKERGANLPPADTVDESSQVGIEDSQVQDLPSVEDIGDDSSAEDEAL